MQDIIPPRRSIRNVKLDSNQGERRIFDSIREEVVERVDMSMRQVDQRPPYGTIRLEDSNDQQQEVVEQATKTRGRPRKRPIRISDPATRVSYKDPISISTEEIVESPEPSLRHAPGSAIHYRAHTDIIFDENPVDPVPTNPVVTNTQHTRQYVDLKNQQSQLNQKSQKQYTENDMYDSRDMLERNPFPFAQKPSGGSFIKKAFIMLVLLAVISVSGLFAYAHYYGGATLTVTPKQDTVTIGGTFEFKEGEYKIFEYTQPVQFAVPAQGEEKVEKKARGTITIFNEFSSVAQKLVKNTRFEAGDGKIYRIQSDIVVPGYKLVNGKKVAGTIDAIVVADASGASYNRQAGDFKLPGLKGTPRYDSYRASVKSAIQGGFVGTQKKVTESAVASGYAQAMNAIQEDFMKNVVEKTPSEYVVLPSLVFMEESTPEMVITENNATNTTTTTAQNQEEFVNYEAYITAHTVGISKKIVDEILINASQKRQGTGESLAFIDTTKIKAEHEKKSQSPWTESVQKIRMVGTTAIEWYFNEEVLRESLAGKAKNNLSEILKAYTGIQNVEAIVRPFWSGTFPASPQLITVIRQNQSN